MTTHDYGQAPRRTLSSANRRCAGVKGLAPQCLGKQVYVVIRRVHVTYGGIPHFRSGRRQYGEERTGLVFLDNCRGSRRNWFDLRTRERTSGLRLSYSGPTLDDAIETNEPRGAQYLVGRFGLHGTTRARICGETKTETIETRQRRTTTRTNTRRTGRPLIVFGHLTINPRIDEKFAVIRLYT